MPAANDFICKVNCQWGPNAFANQIKGPRVQLPPGIYDPPYRINNENSQVTFPPVQLSGPLIHMLHVLVSPALAQLTAAASQSAAHPAAGYRGLPGSPALHMGREPC